MIFISLLKERINKNMKKITSEKEAKYVGPIWAILCGYVVLLWTNTLAPHSKIEIFQRLISIIGIISFAILISYRLYSDGFKKISLFVLGLTILMTFFINNTILNPSLVASFSLMLLFFPIGYMIGLVIRYVRKN